MIMYHSQGPAVSHVRTSRISFESEIPVVFRNEDLKKKISVNAVVFLSRAHTWMHKDEGAIIILMECRTRAVHFGGDPARA